MKHSNKFIKITLLLVAVAAAVIPVLNYQKYKVSLPKDISAKATAEEVFNPSLKDAVAAYSPNANRLNEAEVAYDALVDRASIYYKDTLITDSKEYDFAIAESSEKFAKVFIDWSINGKFSKSVWDENDHKIMRSLIQKMRNVSIEEGSKKALSEETLASLTKIETVLDDYKKAWDATKQTSFKPWDFDDAQSKRTKAEDYAKKEYLKNCVSLVNSLNSVGKKLESSCYEQLTQRVNKLQYRYSFNSKEAYDKESSRVYDLIQTYDKTKAFGVSTSAHAKILKDLQDSYDRAAENHDWHENY